MIVSAMNKYMIANDATFIGRDGNIVHDLVSAQRYKFSEVENSNIEGFTPRPAFTSGKKYVLTSATKFVGGSSGVTTTTASARVFKSVSDAANYIRNHRDLKDKISDPVIISTQFEKVATDNVRKFSAEQLEILGVKKTEPRVKIRPSVKAFTLSRQQGICPICGLPMSNDDCTLDHIKPLSRGGTNKPENLRYVHKRCNSMKNNMTDTEMYKTTAAINAKMMYNSPESREAIGLMRAFFRGVIRTYEENNTFNNTFNNTLQNTIRNTVRT